MTKRRKNWNERKTPQTLAQERYLDQTCERIALRVMHEELIKRLQRWITPTRYSAPIFGPIRLHIDQSFLSDAEPAPDQPAPRAST